MSSTKTQLPYEYYSLPFCKPRNNEIIYKAENLGLWLYYVHFLEFSDF